MKKLLYSLCLLGFAVPGYTQKVINDPNVEVRRVGDFQGIAVSGGIDLYISYGEEVVAVSAGQPEYRNRIKTEVENGILKIWYDYKSGMKLSFKASRNLKAYVSYKTLKSLSGSGGSDIIVDGTLKGADLDLDISGGSDFTGKVELRHLKVDQSGGSDIRISGKVEKLTLDASGGSDFNGYDLTADVCSVEASGGSDVEIVVTREISARASGASDVRYKGSPAVKEAKATGASSVSARS